MSSPGLLESSIKEHIKEYLETLKPKMFYFSIPASPLGRAGIADIICCFNGEFIAIEVKTAEAYDKAGHNMSVAQICFKKMLEASGGVYHCVCSAAMLKKLLFPMTYANLNPPV
jgi:hypothetical protein